MPGEYNLYALTLNADADLAAQLIIEGPVVLNIEEQLEIGDRVILSGIEDPTDFIVYTNQASAARIGVSASFTGIIEAPYAEVTVSPFATMNGCIHGGAVRIEADAIVDGGKFPTSKCGDGTVDSGEVCDDGNNDNSDDCLNNCTLPTCDDGYQHLENETDIDCGGDCAPCAAGQSCYDDMDCESLDCEAGVCVGDETYVTATLVVDTTWQDGYCVTVYITNSGTEATSDWSVRLDTNESRINNLWNGTYNYSEGTVTVDAMSYNAAVYPSSTQTFGFCADILGTDYTPVIETVFTE